ncbi:hypothetical protein A2160_00945 [Candidatus Beckwithbacteria bacterium RBG_13_42_9]|uniref:DUF2905 domain-containing protein n=1 Tax=Candidatus Beckwithbacteria bacterium RBG_13_42_9 TaxID=1797457 RepID=A0A1F5E3I0_9BACT|nr:MAG: hypothetical protein A2160_00945 [Candidatus Beckwithbacteria bacterium RBG_13_42_9]
MLADLARTFLIIGIIFVFFGGLLWILSRLPFLGKLPGDILIKKGSFTLYAPLVTTLIISLIFSIVLTIIGNLKR